jgi:hypothetical protein
MFSNTQIRRIVWGIPTILVNRCQYCAASRRKSKTQHRAAQNGTAQFLPFPLFTNPPDMVVSLAKLKSKKVVGTRLIHFFTSLFYLGVFYLGVYLYLDLITSKKSPICSILQLSRGIFDRAKLRVRCMLVLTAIS